ncbi:MAG: hypothetical protein WCG61_05850 [Chlorobium sp.]
MQALRRIQTTNTDSISIKIPRIFQKRKLEVIVIPIDEKPSSDNIDVSWPKGFFEKTAGCFASAPLVREDQCVYEVRNEIL